MYLTLQKMCDRPLQKAVVEKRQSLRTWNSDLVKKILSYSASLLVFCASAFFFLPYNSAQAAKPNAAFIRSATGSVEVYVQVNPVNSLPARRKAYNAARCNQLLAPTPPTRLLRSNCRAGLKPNIRADQLSIPGEMASVAELALKNCPAIPRNIGTGTMCFPSDPALVGTGPDESSTVYAFPCRYVEVGTGTELWFFKEKSDAECERTTITHAPAIPQEARAFSVSNPHQITSPAGIPSSTLPSDNLPSIDSSATDSLPKDIVEYAPTQKPTLVNFFDADGLLTIDVLIGSIVVETYTGEPIDIPAGNRFVYYENPDPKDVEPINIEETIAKSPALQIFLDPGSWSQEEFAILEEVRVILGLPSTQTFPTDGNGDSGAGFQLPDEDPLGSSPGGGIVAP